MRFDRSLFLETLKQGLSVQGLTVSADSLELMVQYAEAIAVTNESLNLTRLVEPAEMAIKNFLDSLTILRSDVLAELPEELHCLDLGTGAGFPGVPLAIVKPNWQWVLLDSTRKRLNFIAETAEELGLTNVSTLHARAEDAGQEPEHREAYHLVVSRAVAELPVLLELCAPLVAVGGIVAAYKGSEAAEELARSEKAQRELNLGLEKVACLDLPQQMGSHSLLLFKKTGPLAERYPRRAGIVQKRPLI